MLSLASIFGMIMIHLSCIYLFKNNFSFWLIWCTDKAISRLNNLLFWLVWERSYACTTNSCFTYHSFCFVLFIHRNQRQPTPQTTYSEMVWHLNDDDFMNLIFCKFFGRIDQHNVDYNFGWNGTYSFLNLNWLILQILAHNLQTQRLFI